MMLRVVVLLAAPLALPALAGCPATPAAPSTSAAPGEDRRTPITITTTPAGAVVLVDGAPVGEAPVTVPLAPGPHRLRATLSGYYPAPETKIVVERGVAATHGLALVASH
jgi:hypothetical protein